MPPPWIKWIRHWHQLLRSFQILNNFNKIDLLCFFKKYFGYNYISQEEIEAAVFAYIQQMFDYYENTNTYEAA